MSNVLRIEKDGTFNLGGTKLPGQVMSLSMQGKVIMDKAQANGTSGKKKVFSGYDDSDIAIKLLLIETVDSERTRYENLEHINKAFKKIENEQPVVYSVQGEMFKAFGVRNVVFQGLQAEEVTANDSINVSLSFEEHNPVVSLVQEQQKTEPDNSETEKLSDSKIPEGVSKEEFRNFKKLEGLSVY